MSAPSVCSAQNSCNGDSASESLHSVVVTDIAKAVSVFAFLLLAIIAIALIIALDGIIGIGIIDIRLSLIALVLALCISNTDAIIIRRKSAMKSKA